MPSMQESRSETARFDDLYWEPRAEPIVEDDAFLEEIVAQAELPVLLAADRGGARRYVFTQQRPSASAEPGGHPAPSARGMSADQQERARALALAGLRELRDNGITTVDLLPDETVTDLLRFLTAGPRALVRFAEA